uniref:ER membrane protein complex subunit 1 n=1 Tax=Strombidium inclinatum TaxID=197538 RepID=A0A7S3N288_9SPIT|mmetsp:Transcript_41502/g.63353  ORF Transcript_41502/g.63353 Transcript_41502/m.63353 type:complete len:167 (+) Transcript_41502:2456-2956(+)
MSHVTNKALVFITSNNQVYSVEHQLYTARRQTKEEAEAAKERELEQSLSLLPKNETDLLDVKSVLFPQYDGMIPQRNTKFISYDLDLVNLDKLISFSTRLESTSAILATGHDVFFARFMPEGNFDRLNENFKSPLLFGVIVVLVVALFAAQTYIKNKELKEAFLKK